ncbi:MAG: S9 family peptidase [Verrucomicrobiales bacterium]|nr:S9 family peptidase [Verrucomicrobiales bacterium]
MNRLLSSCVLLLAMHFPAPAFPEETARPPLAPQRSHLDRRHGVDRQDPWFWLRDRKDPAVMKYLKAENDWTERQLAPVKKLRDTLTLEMRKRIKETDVSVPVFQGGYHYYHRTEGTQEYGIHARRKGTMDAPEEILLDENVRAAGHDYYSLGELNPGPDQVIASFTENTDGTDLYTLRFKNLTTGELLADEIPKVPFGDAGAWASDNQTLFYVLADDTLRPDRLMRHVLGTPVSEDVEVLREKDPAFNLGAFRCRSGAYLIAESGSRDTSECFFLDAAHPAEKWRMIQPRETGLIYRVDHHAEDFYIVTNADGATNFKLVKTAVSQPGKSGWKDVMPYDPAVFVRYVEPFETWMAIETREQGLPVLRLHDFATGHQRTVGFPESSYAMESGDNPEYGARSYRLYYSAQITPYRVYDISATSGELTLLKQKEVPGYDPAPYVVERLEARAADGVAVPISIVRRRDTPVDGSAPLLLEGYGAYGISSDPWFDPSLLSLLDRGFICATAHIRGGGEFGRIWYEAGRREHKVRTFTDFISCAEHLIARHYTRPDRLCARGASAGGLLIGAVANLRPDLFRALVAGVPFVDCVNTMLDDSLPLTTGEYEEWGDPGEETAFRRILSWSPYDNVKPQTYPALLASGGINDTRVAYWEPAKWVAKLRQENQGKAPLLLWTNLDTGHGGASGRFAALDETARDFAFLLMVLDHREGGK